MSEKIDPNCICHGNWRLIISEYQDLLDRKYRDNRGEIWRFFGVVHGSDDYYYGMYRKGETRLLSCVGSIEGFGYTPVEKRTTAARLKELREYGKKAKAAYRRGKRKA